MTIVDIARGQQVRIPAIQLTNNQEFQGNIRASDGEMLVIEIDDRSTGLVPPQVEEMVVLTWLVDGIQRACPILVRNRSPRALVAQVVIQERRCAPRVKADVQVVYEVVTPDRVRESADEVMSQVNQLGDPGNQASQLLRNSNDPMTELREEVAALRDMLTEVLSRLDQLTTAVLTGAPPASGMQMSPISVQNCSSTGLGLITREAHPEGEYLRLRLTLRTTPQTTIDCMAVIVRCAALAVADPGTTPRGYDLGLHFTHIHESDRERLIQYLFRVQRRILRDLKEARETIANG